MSASTELPTYGHTSVLVGESVMTFGSEDFEGEEGADDSMPVFMLDLGT